MGVNQRLKLTVEYEGTRSVVVKVTLGPPVAGPTILM